MAKEFKSEILKVYDSPSAKKVSIIKWGNNEPTIDIRRFTSEGVPLKGISLSPSEVDDVIVNLHIAKTYFKQYSPALTEPIVDSRETINIMDRISSAPSIVNYREQGHITQDSCIVFKLTPYIKSRIKRHGG